MSDGAVERIQSMLAHFLLEHSGGTMKEAEEAAREFLDGTTWLESWPLDALMAERESEDA